MKNYLRTQITLYEEDKNYPIWRRQERRSKYAVQLASWQLRSNSPKTSVCPSVCRRHGFRSISQVCFGISTSNFICILRVAIGRSLLIFNDVTFKMAAWWPYWIFGFRTLTLLWLWISTSNFRGTILMYMGRSLLIFSNVILKWPPGGHISYFGFWTL